MLTLHPGDATDWPLTFRASELMRSCKERWRHAYQPDRYLMPAPTSTAIRRENKGYTVLATWVLTDHCAETEQVSICNSASDFMLAKIEMSWWAKGVFTARDLNNLEDVLRAYLHENRSPF